METKEPLLNCSGKPPEVIKSLHNDVPEPCETVMENGKHLVNGSSDMCDDIAELPMSNGTGDSGEDIALNGQEPLANVDGSKRDCGSTIESNGEIVQKSGSEIIPASNNCDEVMESESEITLTKSDSEVIAKSNSEEIMEFENEIALIKSDNEVIAKPNSEEIMESENEITLTKSDSEVIAKSNSEEIMESESEIMPTKANREVITKCNSEITKTDSETTLTKTDSETTLTKTDSETTLTKSDSENTLKSDICENSNDSTESAASLKTSSDICAVSKPDVSKSNSETITKSDNEASSAGSAAFINSENDTATKTLSEIDGTFIDAATAGKVVVTTMASTVINVESTPSTVAHTSSALAKSSTVVNISPVAAKPLSTIVNTSHGYTVTHTRSVVVKPVVSSASNGRPTGSKSSTASPASSGIKPSQIIMRPMAGLLYDIGLDLCKQQVYKDLIKIQSRKQTQNRLSKREEQQLSKLRTAHEHMRKRNKALGGDYVQCTRCSFNATSKCALHLHDVSGECGQNMEEPGDHVCAWCDFTSPHLSAYTCHLEMVHHSKARVVKPISAFACSACPFETDTRGLFGKHTRRCVKSFRSKRNLEPMPGDCDIPLKMTKMSQPIPRKSPVPAVRPLMQPRPPAMTRTTLMAPNAVGARMPQVVQVGGQLYTVCNQNGQTLLTPYPATITMPPAPSFSYSKSSVSTLLQQQRKDMPAALAPLPQPSVKPTVMPSDKSSVPSSDPSAPRHFEICEICGGYVKDRASLGVHFYWAHRIELDASTLSSGRQPHLWCNGCRKRFWTYQGLSRHRMTCTGASFTPTTVPTPSTKPVALAPVRCAICGVEKIQQMLSHLETAHGISLDGVLQRGSCVACGDALAGTRAAAQAHFQRAHPTLLASMFSETIGPIKVTERSASCSQCDIITQSFDALVKHVLSKHIHACAHCSQRWSTARGLLQHEREIHPNMEPRRCPLCTLRLRGNREFLRHVRRRHLRRLTVDVKRLSPSVYARYAPKDDVIEVEEEPLIVEERGNAMVLKKMKQ